MSARRQAVTVAALLLFCAPAFAEGLNGPARVIDGNAIEIGGTVVRLRGIDAPDETQICERDGRPWRCGQDAAWALAARIERHWVLCDGDTVAVCYIGGRQGIELNRWMVAQGWATPTSDIYAADQDAAQRASLGLWSGKFQQPADWRAQHH